MSGLYDDFNSKIMEAVVRKKSQHRMSANAPPSTAATVDAQVHTDPQVASKGIFSDLDMNVAVFISADCSGMNAAVRAVVRMGLYVGCNVYLINEGYQGMIDGGDFIQLAEWKTVSNIIQKGGTIIGSAKCDEFRTREGRLKAAFNLVDRNIINLVCIGGDGSLTGANLFQEEWKGLLEELVREGRFTTISFQ